MEIEFACVCEAVCVCVCTRLINSSFAFSASRSNHVRVIADDFALSMRVCTFPRFKTWSATNWQVGLQPCAQLSSI